MPELKTRDDFEGKTIECKSIGALKVKTAFWRIVKETPERGKFISNLPAPKIKPEVKLQVEAKLWLFTNVKFPEKEPVWFPPPILKNPWTLRLFWREKNTRIDRNLVIVV